MRKTLNSLIAGVALATGSINADAADVIYKLQLKNDKGQVIREIEPGQAYTLEATAERPQDGRQTVDLRWRITLPQNISLVRNVSPQPVYEGDFFCQDAKNCYLMGTGSQNLVTLANNSRRTQRQTDEFGFPVGEWEGPRSGKGIIGKYEIALNASSIQPGVEEIPFTYVEARSDVGSQIAQNEKLSLATAVSARTTPLMILNQDLNEGVKVYTTGVPGRRFQLQSSDDLTTWTTMVPGERNIDMTYTNAVYGSFELHDKDVGRNCQTRFYRTVESK